MLEKLMEAVAPSCRLKDFLRDHGGINKEKMLKSQKKLTFALLGLNHGGKLHHCVMRRSEVVLGLHGKVLIVGSYKAGFREKLLEDFPMPDGANSSCSKRDLLLDKAQPVGNNGSALGKNPDNLSWKRKERKPGTKSSLEEGMGGVKAIEGLVVISHYHTMI
ncbi:hypothetical protein DUI87_26878 [Hirundo rustica rustica]|uniref:Uncharacterized protein n=1 Tax=Hirundo rustica rustica TaxID=333673 RepID=A0A3M0J631_HIRRU|nr:hypothetical protein DUI87_26878 [Hirundo rustica rustica]